MINLNEILHRTKGIPKAVVKAVDRIWYPQSGEYNPVVSSLMDAVYVPTAVVNAAIGWLAGRELYNDKTISYGFSSTTSD